jgi:hypothetical protein
LTRSTILDEFLMYFWSVHPELSEKQKPPAHHGGGLQSSGGDLFGEFPRYTSSGTFVLDQGHLGSPLPGCQTHLRVIPDADSQRIGLPDRHKKILCYSSRTFVQFNQPG